MIKVTSEVKIYEIGGKEVKLGTNKVLSIESHWNKSDFVNITLPGFDPITVPAGDLKAAIENAQNASRY